MKIAVIGLGYWGPKLVRNFLNNKKVEKVFCYDIDQSRTTIMKQQFPTVVAVRDYEEIIDNPEIDAVVIATPVGSHYLLAQQALMHNKHILIEKPLTSSYAEASALVSLAKEKGLKLMVDHIFMYHGAIRKIKEIIDADEIGDIMYFDAVRINLGLFQHDVNVIWDLAIHDLSIMDYLLEAKPRAVSAVGIGHYNQHENISYLTLFFDHSCIAHIHVNWLAPVKMRRILLGGTKKMVVFDDIEPVEKIRIYDKGVMATTQEGIYKTLIQYRTGDMFAPRFDTTEPLTVVTDEFIDSIENNTEPLSNGVMGLNMIKILETAERSIKNNGLMLELN